MNVCPHLADLPTSVTPNVAGLCAQCVADGTTWVHLRVCLSCGNVSCCDSSPGQHATAHFVASAHPVMQSVQPGEDWRWCYIDEAIV